MIYFFLGAGFFAAFLAAGFLAAGFLAAGFLAAFLAAGFLAAFLAGFLAFLALGFLTFLAFLGFSTLPTLNLPAPLPAALALTMVPAARAFLRASFSGPAALAASTLLLATTYLRMAWRDEPPLSLRAGMAARIIALNGGWAAGLATFLALTAFTTGAGAASAIVCLLR